MRGSVWATIAESLPPRLWPKTAMRPASTIDATGEPDASAQSITFERSLAIVT